MISQVAPIELPIGTVKLDTTPKFKTLAQVEQEHLLMALELYKNNKNETAKALGISAKTLYNKLHTYGLFEKYEAKK
jgi:DNA-binding NtrC family response regulator